MIPAFTQLLGRSSQKPHVGVHSGTTFKRPPHFGVSLLFEDINPAQYDRRTRNTTTRAAMDNSNANSSSYTAEAIANRTFAIVKPDALTPFKYQQVDALIKLNEFEIVRQKLIWLSKDVADALFPEKATDADYQDWVDYITSAPSMALELSKINATLFWQLTMGSDDPNDGSGRDSDSIRGILAVDRIRNAVDGSQEPEDAANQLALVFSDKVPELPYDNFLMQRGESVFNTLALIKPDIAQDEKAVSHVIRRITGRGYLIKDRVEIKLSNAQARAFYAEHAGKPFFDGL
ncbi:hypothetical protein GGF37_006408, partial [Kickxella alabastrina]